MTTRKGHIDIERGTYLSTTRSGLSARRDRPMSEVLDCSSREAKQQRPVTLLHTPSAPVFLLYQENAVFRQYRFYAGSLRHLLFVVYAYG